ncbi:BTAD domain-containing putative transcriptional regulator [Hamadaea sp. NPDC051192]|uniref:AfsR/SARP family transcriptional regulator n=1 Tax=Hamadaea sp. NPDC051192 TaxID=3154940 RepID=UPI00341D6B0B
MLIRLLGPVEVERGGLVRPVRPPQVALTLAALAWEAGRVVPVDALLGRVWGEHVPPGARRTLQTLITRIRHEVLAGDGTVIGRLGGYLLDVAESAVDLLRFRELAERARGEPDPASTLTEALRLWQGDPMCGLPGEWPDRVRQRLRDERKETLLRWAQVSTERDAGAVVAAVTPLVAEYPLDEPLAAVLVAALHANGRTAEALAAFARVRRTLVDELGVEPGSVLRQTHQVILRADHASAELVPSQVPGPLRGFAGRTAELTKLDSLAGSGGVGLISGQPGVGKSTLAAQWAAGQAARFPDGRLHADLSSADPGAVLPQFLGALGVPPDRVPAGLAAQTGLYRSILSGRRVLVMLDDARSEEQVRPLLAVAPGCLTLVTSRLDLSSLTVTTGAELIRLDVLPEGDAYQLLAARLGMARLAAEPTATSQIVQRCGRLPLALAIVAARLAAHPDLPLSDVASQTADANLEPFRHSDPTVDLRGVFGRSYRDLSTSVARLFRHLGCHPGPHLSLAAAASLAATTVDRTREGVLELDRANLVGLRPSGRLQLHDLLRAYAAEQIRGPERRAALRRLLDHTLHTACAANALCYPHRDRLTIPAPARGTVIEPLTPGSALQWYADEAALLPGLVAAATKAGQDRHAWQIAWAFAEFLQRRGQWEEILRVHAVAVAAAERLADRLAQARCHNSIARAYAKLGRDHEAVQHFDRAVELHRDLDEPALLAHVYLGASGPMSRVRPGDQIEQVARAGELFHRAGDELGEARALNTAGWWRAEAGQYEQALADCGRAQRILAELGFAQGEGHAWDSIAYIHHRRGEYAAAVAGYERAAELLHGSDDLHAAAETLVRLGTTQLSAGDTAAGLDAWKQAAEYYEVVGDTRAATGVRERVAAQYIDR